MGGTRARIMGCQWSDRVSVRAPGRREPVSWRPAIARHRTGYGPSVSQVDVVDITRRDRRPSAPTRLSFRLESSGFNEDAPRAPFVLRSAPAGDLISTCSKIGIPCRADRRSRRVKLHRAPPPSSFLASRYRVAYSQIPREALTRESEREIYRGSFIAIDEPILAE